MESEDEDDLAIMSVVLSAAAAIAAVADSDWSTLGLPREPRAMTRSNAYECALAVRDERWFRASVRCSIAPFGMWWGKWRMRGLTSTEA